jgi:trehalose-phosphatase
MTAELTHRPVALLRRLDELEERVAAAPHILLFLDFDGTISRLVANPKDAVLDPEIRSILSALTARQDFTVAIVSGRAVSDLRERAGLRDVIYVGNHGLEVESDSIRFREPKAEALRRELRSLCLQLKLALSDTDGLEVEDKGLTLSVHFRRVIDHLHDWVRSVTSSTVSRSRSFGCREGKLVLDVQPQIGWNKGRAIQWIASKVGPSSAVPIYIGDDVTDEDAFAAIPQGITIRVGEPASTAAQYSLPDVAAVGQVLQWLDRAKPHASVAITQRAGR